LSLVVYSKELVGTQTRSRALLRLGAPSRVVAISRRTGDNLTALGVHRSRIRVVSPTIAPPWRAEAPTVRTSGRGLHVVCVSRLVEGYKNFEVLIRAAAVLAESGAVEQLTLVGGGPRLAALERKVAALHAQQVVHLTGEVTDAELRDILLTAHVGVLPSRDTPGEGFEGFGLVVHELAAAGMPVLVGRAGGAVDAIDESWGILLDPDDLRAWVVTLDELAQNEPRRAAMSAAAVRWAESLDPHEAPAAMLEALMP
jgi:phosphatidylinositol alpha-1,6-mannosyltransferase